MEQLLGPTLQNKDGEVPTSSLSSSEVIGLYFSAHWCPPCRRFTPELAKTYKKMKDEGKKMEIVFLSSDEDEAAFSEYYGEMPWLALPYAERKTKGKLSKKFKVQGIPTLILLDSAGNVLSKDGRTAIASPENYPWPARSVSEMLGTTFVSKSGEVGKEAIEGKYLGLYFSASWCPPCRQFTPDLAQMVETLRKSRDDFEFIFVSRDKDEKSFTEYYQKMPFLAIPYKDLAEKYGPLSSHFEVEGIPTLVILSPEGNTITTDGRSRVGQDLEGKEFPYYPKVVNNVDNPSGINETTSLVILAEGESKSTQEKYEALLFKFGEEAKQQAGGEDPEMLFFIGTTQDGVAKRLRSMASLGSAVEEGEGEEKKEIVCDGDECKIVKTGGEKVNTKILLLDIPDEGGFYVLGGEVTEELLRKFLEEFKEGKLADRRQQLQ